MIMGNRNQRRRGYRMEGDRDRPYYGGSRRRSNAPRESISFDRSDSSEPFFGDGEQSFGGGYSSGEHERGTNSQWRDARMSRRPVGRRYPEPSSLDRDDYRLGYDRGYGRSYGHEQDHYPNREYTESEIYGSRTYGSRYPTSEEGYMTDRERYEDRGWLDKASDEVSSWFGDEEAEHRREMDRKYGQYSGVGPKGYIRSDERIKEDVNDRLTYHAYLDASDIDVQVDNGDIVLTGAVATKYEKRYAEDTADKVNGVKNVENRLRVNSQAWTGRSASANAAGENAMYSGGDAEKSKTAGQS